ncbi:hypothetical protein G6F56_014536 [Rhizopus delemar]|nr:hypothetical protein G6F56_014536 [Rhizopus delemar]
MLADHYGDRYNLSSLKRKSKKTHEAVGQKRDRRQEMSSQQEMSSMEEEQKELSPMEEGQELTTDESDIY